MSQFIIDLFFTFIFVILAILLMRIRDKAFVENRESYRYTAAGIFVLFLVSLVRMLNHQQLFASVPFLSEPVCQDLTEAIGIIAGIALMMAGVSIWLPVKKRRTSELEAEIERNSSVQNIEWEINGIEKVTRLFETVPQLICDKFGLTGSAVFMKPSGCDRFICRYSYLTEFAIGQYSIDSSGSQCISDILNKATIRLKAGYCMPLTVNGKVRAVIYFWKVENRQLDSDDIHALERIGRILSERLNRNYISLKEIFYEGNWLYLSQVRRLVSRRIDLKSSLTDFSMMFKQAVGAEYFSLAVLDKARLNMKRYTSGINRRVLLEDGVMLPVEGTQIGTVIGTRQGLLVRDVSVSGGTQIDSLFLSCGQSSLITVPIINYGRVIGCLTLGNPRPGYFSCRDQLRIETMAAALAPAVEAAVMKSAIFERDRYLGALSAFDTIVENSRDIDSLLNSGADILMENVRTTMVRVTLLDPDRSRLHTKALKLIRSFDSINSDTIGLSRELTPWHNMVVREGRLLLINQNYPETSFDEIEAQKLVFEGVNSALIVPIVVNGVTHGLITLGEMRNWDRFAYDSIVILFCKQIAARMASFIKLYNISRLLSKPQKVDRDRLQENDIDRHLLREIKSPLTRLRGSIDLLKTRGIGSGGDSDQMLSAIEKSADHIATLINEDSEL